MAVTVVAGFAVKLSSMFRCVFSPVREITTISFPEVIVMIHMSVKVLGAMEPGSGADKYSAVEPFRTVVAIWSTVIGRDFVIPVGANRWRSDTYGNLR